MRDMYRYSNANINLTSDIKVMPGVSLAIHSEGFIFSWMLIIVRVSADVRSLKSRI